MSDLLPLIAWLVSTGCFVLLLYYFISYLSMLVERMDSDIKSKSFSDALARLDNIIENNVISTNQKLVISLKKSADFYQIDKEEAFYQTVSSIDSTIRESDLFAISPYIGNTREWINSRVEYFVKLEKLKGG